MINETNIRLMECSVCKKFKSGITYSLVDQYRGFDIGWNNINQQQIISNKLRT